MKIKDVEVFINQGMKNTQELAQKFGIEMERVSDVIAKQKEKMKNSRVR